MRVHHLELTAFGPFAETQRVDLEALGEAGLFLISGPTGSGKTSLLDAVSFALFGSVPGTRVPKQLRSQHVDPSVSPEVVLEVTLSARRFRIRRSPSFERPGRKTPVQASVTLDELVDGAWVHLTGRLDEAGRILEDVLGMTVEQFHRVVVLPQGAFAAFLHASNDQRGELLRRLFDVETFADVEAWLVEERKRLATHVREDERDLERVRHSLVRVLSMVPEPEGVTVETVPWSELRGRELVEAVAAVDERIQQAALTALTEADATDAAHRSAETLLAEARERASQHDRGTTAAAELAVLDAGAEEQAERVERLSRAQRGSRVLALQGALDRAETHRRGVQADADRAATAVGAEAGSRDDDGLTAWLEHLEEHDEAIDELTHESRRWQQCADRLPQLAAEVEAAQAALHRVRDERAGSTDRHEEAGAALEQARAAAVDVERLAGTARTLSALLDARTEHDELITRALPAAADRVRDARDVAQAARETHQDLMRRRLDDMAGELAEGLSPGDPCLVCGSPDHPAPARRRSSVDDAAIEAAEAVWRAATSSVDEAREHLAGLTARADQLATVLADETRDAEALERGAEALASELAGRQAVAATAPQAETALERSRAELADAAAREEALAARLHRAESLAEAEQGQVTTCRETVLRLLDAHAGCPCLVGQGSEPAEARHEDESDEADGTRLLEQALAVRPRHEAATSRARELQEARRAVARAAVLVAEAEQERDAALRAEGFATVAETVAAVLDPQDTERLAQQVASYTESRAVAVAALEDPLVVAAMTAPRPDVDRLTTDLEQARDRWQRAVTLRGQVQHAAREVAEHRRQVVALVDKAGTLADRLDLVSELAGLASGRSEDNPDGIALTTYVLAVRLERIVALANERLTTMADGRYELEVDHGRSDKRSRGGLGLQVLDQWTGAYRPATTLSGGETFMVALALALGTADAVREESGGVDLQTLFIDEGFGSLDDAALEQVLTVLDDLRSGGRSVGVISHVADMRQRIPAQLRVSKTASGSTVEISLDVDDAA